MKYLVTPGHLGRTSASWNAVILEEPSNEPLLTHITVLANVDIMKQKAVPIDDCYISQWGRCYKGPVPNISPLPRPKHQMLVHKFSRQAFASDTDHLDHVNQPFYNKFFLDAASLADKNGLLSGFKDNTFQNCRVRSIEAVYKGQISEGDIVDIYVWETEGQPLTLHFEIENNEAVVTRTTMSFYPQSLCCKL